MFELNFSSNADWLVAVLLVVSVDRGPRVAPPDLLHAARCRVRRRYVRLARPGFHARAFHVDGQLVDLPVEDGG